MKSIIEVKNISKKYNITRQQGSYVALRDVLTNVIKKPFTFAKHKAKKIIGKAGNEDFWALKDINFSVEQGEAIGIIGANGAGKSTLLKILTRITPPTSGEIIMRGKVASLLEVGTGFHPELSGRENIFLNGAILGMRKAEISQKFDQIVEFSGIGKFIDTPVKRYSSGMYVRLAFSVAAHLEPDILLVDEVLAVGDAQFQKKCLGKMDEVTKKAGRTILFVSHNMQAIQKLCARCILLDKGKIQMIGTTKETVDKYSNENAVLMDAPLKIRTDRSGNGKLKFSDIKFFDARDKEIKKLNSGQDVKILFYYDLFDKSVKNIYLTLIIIDPLTGERIAHIGSHTLQQAFKADGQPIVLKIKKLPLTPGTYQFSLLAWSKDQKGIEETLDQINNACLIEVNFGDYYGTGILPEKKGHFLVDYHFN